MTNVYKWVGAGLLVGLSFASWADVSVKVLDSEGRPLTDAVVMLQSERILNSVQPLENIQIAQLNREFVPDLTVITAGTSVAFPNQDTVRHHVYSFSPAKTFELKLYSGEPDVPVLFNDAGVVELGCNIHDSMLGWVIVSNSNVFARTDEQGEVVFSDEPEDNYNVAIWHRSFAYGQPFYEQALTVQAVNSIETIQLPNSEAGF